MNIAKFATATFSVFSFLALATATFAQEATLSGAGGGGGTSGALPDSGSTELTYVLFLGGLVLFIVGTMKVILSFRDKVS